MVPEALAPRVVSRGATPSGGLDPAAERTVRSDVKDCHVMHPSRHPVASPRSRAGRIALCAAVLLLAVPTAALAQDQTASEPRSNDITLGRFLSCEVTEASRCRQVLSNDEAYRALSRDLGLIIQPVNAAPAGTLGVAGFAFQANHSFHTIDPQSEAWQLGRVDRTSDSDLLHVTQFHARKGLPFGFELGGSVGHLWGSEIMTIGSDIKFSPMEDIFWPGPDLSFRGNVGTLLGVPAQNLIVAGADALLGVRLGIGNVMMLSPWAGYSLLTITSSSRLLDADPSELRAQNEPTTGNVGAYRSEHVFEPETEVVHRALVGMQFRFTSATLAFEAALGSSDVQRFTLALGAEF